MMEGMGVFMNFFLPLLLELGSKPGKNGSPLKFDAIFDSVHGRARRRSFFDGYHHAAAASWGEVLPDLARLGPQHPNAGKFATRQHGRLGWAQEFQIDDGACVSLWQCRSRPKRSSIAPGSNSSTGRQVQNRLRSPYALLMRPTVGQNLCRRIHGSG